MSLVGQVDWYFQVIVCARDTCGMAIVAAPVAAVASKNLRRPILYLVLLMWVPSLGSVCFVRGWQFVAQRGCRWHNVDRIMLQVTNTSTYHFSLDRARK